MQPFHNTNGVIIKYEIETKFSLIFILTVRPQMRMILFIILRVIGYLLSLDNRAAFRADPRIKDKVLSIRFFFSSSSSYCKISEI